MYELGIRIAARIDAQRAKELANAYAATPSTAVAEDDDEVEDRETVRYDD